MVRPRRRLHEANSTLPDEPYLPQPYRPPNPIVRTHRLPRLGFTKNIGALWEGSDEQIEQYIIGICVNSIIIVGVVAICLLLLFALRWMGYERVGFWCGRFKYVEEENECDVVSGEGECGEICNQGAAEEGECKEDKGISNVDGSASKGNFRERTAKEIDEENGSLGGNAVCNITECAIGSGECVERSNHVSTRTGVNDEPEEAKPMKEGGSDEAILGNDGVDNATKQKPELKGFRLQVAKIDVGDGKLLVPKPVPKKLFLKVKTVRLAFILCGVGASTSAILFYVLGVKKFKQSLAAIQTGTIVSSQRVNDLALRSINVTDNLLRVQQSVEERLNATDDALGVIIRSCDVESFVNGTPVVEYYETIKYHFNAMSNTTKLLLNGFSENMKAVAEASTVVHEQSYAVNIAFVFMVLIMCMMIGLIMLMIIGVGFAAYEMENCLTRFMRRHFLLPFFVLQVILATLFAAIFFIVALSGSDYCITPNFHAKRMLSRIAAGSDDALSPLFTLLLFYLSGCREVNDVRVATVVQGVAVAADEVLQAAHAFTNLFNTLTPQDVLTYCNVSKELIWHFDDLGFTLHNTTHQLHDALYDTLDILSCRSIHPVYSSLVHEAVCIGAVGGAEAIFSSMLAIALLSMMMLAFRAALYPIKQVKPPTSGDSILPEPTEETDRRSNT